MELFAEGGGKDKSAGPVARVTVLQLTSTPVDQEHKSDRERDFSDEEDEFSSAEEEVGDLSDSEPLRSKLPHTRVSLFFTLTTCNLRPSLFPKICLLSIYVCNKTKFCF